VVIPCFRQEDVWFGRVVLPAPKMKFTRSFLSIVLSVRYAPPFKIRKRLSENIIQQKDLKYIKKYYQICKRFPYACAILRNRIIFVSLNREEAERRAAALFSVKAGVLKTGRYQRVGAGSGI
jgi:hypothetical protein